MKSEEVLRDELHKWITTLELHEDNALQRIRDTGELPGDYVLEVFWVKTYIDCLRWILEVKK